MFDVKRFLEDNLIDYWEEGKNVQEGWVNINCLFCDDPSNHGGFNIEKEYYHCWRCGWHPLEEVVSTLLNIDNQEAFKVIKEYSTEFVLTKKLNKNKDENRGKSKGLNISNLPIPKMGIVYLKKRGFEPNLIIEKYDLRWGGEFGKWKYRIVIPIYFKGQIVSFQGRDVTGFSDLRYKTTKDFIINPKNILYNIDRTRKDRIGVVEGVTDVWRLGDGFVATFGTSLTPSQLKLLGQWKNIFFLFDPEDKEAQKKAEKYSYDLNFSYGSSCEVILIDSPDPGSMSEEEVEYVRKELGFK